MPDPWRRFDVDADSYDARFAAREQAGENVHGEVDFLMRLQPHAVLDAGCGTGRVAIELARRGVRAVGVDVDGPMLEVARRKAPDLEWHRADLVDVDLGARFDVVVMAGNVLLFVTPGTEAQVIAGAARHLLPGGALVTGFQLGHGYDLARFDADAEAAGLRLEQRFATWGGDPWREGGDYAVSVHRRD